MVSNKQTQNATKFTDHDQIVVSYAFIIKIPSKSTSSLWIPRFHCSLQHVKKNQVDKSRNAITVAGTQNEL